MAGKAKYAVFYYSRGGSTRKVAEAMAKALGTIAVDVKSASAKDVPGDAVLFVGSGVYGGRAGREMMDFLQSLPMAKKGKAATFETSGDGRKVVAGIEMAGILKSRGYTITGNFACPGKVFGIFRRGKPATCDMESAASFAGGLSKHAGKKKKL